MLLTDVKGNLQMLKGGSRFESLTKFRCLEVEKFRGLKI
jgi:hypothetical protein